MNTLYGVWLVLCLNGRVNGRVDSRWQAEYYCWYHCIFGEITYNLLAPPSFYKLYYNTVYKKYSTYNKKIHINHSLRVRTNRH